MTQPSPRGAIGVFSTCLLSFLFSMMPFVQIAGASSEIRSRLIIINETLSPPIVGFVVTKVALPAAVLTIAKDFSSPGNDPVDTPEEQATAGSTGNTFFIVVTNSGDAAANNVVISDVVPATLTVTNVTGTLGTQLANPTLNDNDIAWSIPTLGAGQSVTLTVTYSVGANVNAQLVINVASVGSDEISLPVTDSDDVQIIENVTLTIAKDFSNPGNDSAGDTPEETATAGSSGNTFFIIVTNTGTSTADNVVITDSVSAALTVTNVSGTLGSEVAPNGDNNIQWAVPSLGAGQSVTLTVTYSVGANVNTQVVNNTASVSSDEQSSIQDSDDVAVVESVTLTIAKDFSNPGNDPAGDTPEETVTAGTSGNTFFIIVTNTGTSTADNVVISDVVPAALTVTNVIGTLGTQVANPTLNDNDIAWSIPSLGAGQSVTVTVTYSVGIGVSSQLVINAASVASDEISPVTNSDDVQIIAVIPSLTVQDAQVPEPSSGSVNMVFTVTLSAPAPAGGSSVNFTTQEEAPALNHATAGQDYTTTSGTVNFATGEQIKTINVPVLSDPNAAESNETFLVFLSSPLNVTIADGTATGTILITNQPGTLLISELRTSGPAGAGDDFVEIYNNSDTPHTVNGTGGGYGLFKMGATCSDAPVLIGVIPNGTVVPARGHFLFTGSAYSLANYGGSGAAAGDTTLTSDIENDRNVSLFSTTSVLELSSTTRFDAVGFGANTGGICDLQREGSTLSPLSGSTLEYSYFRKMCDFVEGVGCSTPGNPKDTNNNASDFLFANTSAAVTPAGQLLGAPGPENLGSPIRRDATIGVLLLDTTKLQSAAPNRVRDLSDTGTNKTFGTLAINRRIFNNTGGTVTRLRFRIVEFSTFLAPTSPGTSADLRALTSSTISIGSIGDAVTCGANVPPDSAPCTVTVNGTTVETPPAQPSGGGMNSTMTVPVPGGLANGASINVRFLLGVQQTGSFRYLIIVEALP